MKTKVLDIAESMGTVILFRMELIEKLNNNGLANWISANEYKANNLNELKSKRITFVPIQLRSRGYKNYFISVFKLVRLILKQRFTVVHTNTPLGGIVERIVVVLSRVKPKVFHTTRGIPITRDSKFFSKFFYFKIERWLAKNTDYIFSPSKIDIEIYKSKGLKPKKEIVHCGPAGFNPQKFLLDKKNVYRKFILDELSYNSEITLVGIVAEW